MAHTININTVGNALGQYCVQYGARINKDLHQGFELESFLPKVSTDHAYQGVDAGVSGIIQAYQKAFTPNNAESFDGVLNTLQIGKADLEFDWLELEKFFDKWRCNWFEAGKPEQDWTYPRYIIDQLIMPKMVEEMNISSWNGVHVAPTAGTASTFDTAFDGFGKKITDYVTAGSLTPIATGALTATTMVAQVRDFCKGLPQLYRYKKGTILMSKTNAQMYADDYQVKYPSRRVTEESHDQLYLRVDHLNKTIKGLDSMEGSDRIVVIFDNMDSMIIGTKKGVPVMPTFRFHVVDRSIHCLTEFYRFFGFESLKHMFVNDQA